MNVVTLRDYAKNNNISYEAVRKQVVRYADELGDHIIRDGRQQFLDEEAVAFLDAKRQKNPVAIIQQDKDDTIRDLERENKALLIKIASLQEERDHLKDEKHALELETAKIALLEADNEQQRVKIAEAEQKAVEANSEAFNARVYAAELEAYLNLPWLVRTFTKKPELKNVEAVSAAPEEQR